MIHLNEAGADLTLLTTVGVDPIHLIMGGTDHILVLILLTVGLQMAAIEGVSAPTHHMTQDMMIATIQGGNDPTLHITRGMMMATIEGGIDPTLHMTLGMILLMNVTIEDTDIIQFLEVLHHQEGALGGAILVVSPPNRREAQDQAILTAFLLDQGARGGATLGAYPQDQGKVSHVEVCPSGEMSVRYTLGAPLGARVQVPDPSLDL